jgi:hypothetical protein
MRKKTPIYIQYGTILIMVESTLKQIRTLGKLEISEKEIILTFVLMKLIHHIKELEVKVQPLFLKILAETYQ